MPRNIWTRFSFKVLKKMNILSLPFWNRLRSHILLPNWFPPLRFGLSCGDFPGGPGKPRTPRFLGDPAGLLFLFVPVFHFSRGSLGNLVSQEFPVVQAGLEVLQDPMKGTHSNRRPINDMVVIKRKKIITILFFFILFAVLSFRWPLFPLFLIMLYFPFQVLCGTHETREIRGAFNVSDIIRKPSRYSDNFHLLRINDSVRLILSFHLILSFVLSLACQTALMAVRNLFDNIWRNDS